MRIPGNLLESIPIALVEIFQQTKSADRVVDFYLKNNKKWGSRDRRYFAEVVYTIVRNYRKLWIQADLNRQDYLNAEKVNLATMQKLVKSYFDGNEKEFSLSFAEKESYTDWFDQVGREELGVEWESIAHALNEQAPVFLRTNFLKTNREKLIKNLEQEEIPCRIRPENETAIELTARKNVFITKAFLQGLFEVQDFSSQQVAPLVDPKPGEIIVDGCAGAGGKTLHLAAMMKNKGKIFAFDIHEKKLAELQRRSTRAGCAIIETKIVDKKALESLKNLADAVLLDVPCSGSGVIRRNPDTKWKFEKKDFEKICGVQHDILQNYSKMVKPGGRLVYATCSIFPSENIKQVAKFLKNNEEFSLISSKLFRPDRDPGDGFFVALLKRSDVISA